MKKIIFLLMLFLVIPFARVKASEDFQKEEFVYIDDEVGEVTLTLISPTECTFSKDGVFVNAEYYYLSNQQIVFYADLGDGVQYAITNIDVTNHTFTEPIDYTSPIKKSDVAKWFEEKAMPLILSAISAMLGTGAIGFIFRKLLHRVSDKTNSDILEAAKALNLSNEKNELLKTQLLNTQKIFEEKVNVIIDDKLSAIQNKIDGMLKTMEVNQEIRNKIDQNMLLVSNELKKAFDEEVIPNEKD